MSQPHSFSFPGESPAYREARNALLEEERRLRRQVEAVAAARRALPAGGALKKDYVFAEGGTDLDDPETKTRFSALFAPGKDSLIVYSFMYGPDAAAPCPMCSAFLDSLNANAEHIAQHAGLAVVAKAPIHKIRTWARGRGWHRLRLLSTGGTSYNQDHFGEGPDGGQWPSLNVFRRTDAGIHHTWNSELFFAGAEEGQHPRHVDMLWPLWNVLDLTPDGRPQDWFPAPSYD